MSRPLFAALGSITLVLASAALMPGQEPDAKPARPQGKTTVKGETKAVPAKVEMKKAVVAPPAPVVRPVEALKAVVQFFAPGQAQPAAPNLEPMIRESMQQIRPLLRSEVHFIQTTCELNAEQTARLGRAGEVPLRDAAQRLVEMQNGMMRAPREPADPQQLLEDRMVAIVAEQLPAEKAERYREAAAARAAFRKEATISGLVASIDQEVSLSPEQRQRLADALAKHWNPAWSQSLEWLRHGTQFFPDLPGEVITPVLNETQKQLWLSKPRGQTIYGFSGTALNLDRQPWEEDEPPPQQGIRQGMIMRVAPARNVR
jgi:hypothetical protein